MENTKVLEHSTYGEPSHKVAFILHGFKGFKDWGFIPYIANYIATHSDIQVVTFNFSHNGVKPGEQEISDLEKFEQNTYTKEIQDLTQMIGAAQSGYFGKKAQEIYLIGHSRGGGIALLTASKLKESQVKKVVTYATIAQIDKFSPSDMEIWKNQGYLEVINGRNGQVLRVGKALYQEIVQYKDTALNICQAAQSLHIPILLFHGIEDETVSYTQSQDIYTIRDNNQLPTVLVLIEGTNHTFGITHPLKQPSEAVSILAQQTVEFLTQEFKQNNAIYSIKPILNS